MVGEGRKGLPDASARRSPFALRRRVAVHRADRRDGWRLPSVKELLSVVAPALDPTVFNVQPPQDPSSRCGAPTSRRSTSARAIPTSSRTGAT